MPGLPIVNRAFSGADVDQHPLEHFVEIERFAGHVLEVPHQLAVVEIERHRGRGVERRVRGLVAAARPASTAWPARCPSR